MEKKLEIPYRSQKDSDANYAPSDCGAACVAMILEAFGIRKTIDEIFKATGQDQKNPLSRLELIRAAVKYKLEIRKFNDGDQAYLKQSIDARKPIIALVNYKAWSTDPAVPTQSSFANTHFVVVTGYEDGNVTLNDPLWWRPRRAEGHHKKMTFAQFVSAWGSCSEFPGQPDFAGLITKVALPGPPPPQVKPVKEAEINRIMAWAAFMGLKVEEEKLAMREVANVYLDFVGPWGTRVVDHVLREGEDLGILALRYYGDPMKWKVISEYNNLPVMNAFEGINSLKIPEPTRQ